MRWLVPVLLASPLAAAAPQHPIRPRPELLVQTPPAVRQYVIPRAATGLRVDGRLDDPGWSAAEWTEWFTDIEGDLRDAPRYRTRAKLLWDDHRLYVGAEMEEPDLWATLTRRDAVIFHDHDFELFLDPDGDTHAYFELEINALGTVWDLFLPRPYRDGGEADHSWNITGLRSAVALRGTLNDPSDRDSGWTVELAIPWTSLAPRGQAGRPPAPGDQWRVNFSRVEWDLMVKEGRYAKRMDPASGKPVPEHNWVWSPQHAVNMHLPELWAVVTFAAHGAAPVRPPPDDDVRWALRRVYYAQTDFRKATGRHAAETAELRAHTDVNLDGPVVTIVPRPGGYEATARGRSGAEWRIREDGRVWRP